MFCTRCGHENPDEARFCASCGAPQSIDDEPREAGPYRPLLHTGPADIPVRDFGELISETFSLYGRAVGPFFAIAFIPELPNLLSFAVDGLAEGLLSLLSILLGIVSAGASIVCTCRVITGQSADVAVCYSRALNFLARLFVASLLIFLALAVSVLLMLVIVGIPLFFYLVVAWFFTPHVIILERLSAVDALRRSRDLVRGSWWRVFGIGIGFVLLIFAVLIPAIIVAGIVTIASPALGTVTFVVAGALVAPIVSIGSTLVYIDLRVRKEGYNLDTLAL
ncbi:MAG: zinc-ribbon domain-containing protein [Chloroflexi bacterium]|nr:zinc-ribbon domain-containing protein [Chloroflexota bacterium]